MHTSMELLLFACVLASAAGAAVGDHGSETDLNTTSKFVELIRTGDSVVYYTPAVFYLGLEAEGNRKKLIKRCLVEDPDNCEVFHEGFGTNHILVHMEYVYLATWNSIARCESYRKQSCSYIHETMSQVFSLTVRGEHLYAGLINGSILVCDLQQPYSCRTLHTFTNREVWSVQATDEFIYAGLDNGHLMRCSVNEDSVSCTLSYNMDTFITGLTILENTIFATSWNGRLWKCSEESDTASRCVFGAIDIPYPKSIASFNGSLYIIKQKEEEGLYICNWSSNPKCRNYGHHKTYYSIAFAYGTHHIQTYYKNEDTACSWRPDSLCPPYVTYYDLQQRSKFEVHVKDGRLYDAAGTVVDTTRKVNCDEQSGPAIFVMAPSGKILLRNSTDPNTVFTSSLMAGGPVSGAGEMVVEHGVIKKIAACARHYLPDLRLNKQVVDSLRSQGYTEPIVSEKCCDGSNWPKSKVTSGVESFREFKELQREFNEIKNLMGEIREFKERQREFNEIKNQMGEIREFKELQREFNEIKNQMGEIREFKELQREFNEIKNQMGQIREFKELQREFNEIKNQMGEIREFKELQRELNEIKNQMGEIREFKELQRELNEIKNQMGEIREFKELQREFNEIKNQMAEIIKVVRDLPNWQYGEPGTLLGDSDF